MENQFDSSKKILDCEFLGKCTTTLKIDSYVPIKDADFIIINCLTSDGKKVIVFADIERHDEETKLKENDVVKFIGAIRFHLKENTFSLKIEQNTKVYLLVRNGKNLKMSKEMLEYKIFGQKKNDKLKSDPVDYNGFTHQSQKTFFIKKYDYFYYNDESFKVDEKPKFTCPICFEVFVKQGRICCTPFENLETKEKIKGHEICVNCIKGMAAAALTDTPLAPGGIGLPCCVPDCENMFLMSEFGSYLDLKVRDALMLRMQHESVLAANMDDLVTCPDCSYKICVDQCLKYYHCVCSGRRCRNCLRLYDKAHSNLTCEEMEDKEIEIKLSEVVVRNCPKCHLQFVKKNGCNEMICRCGTHQCYLCRQIIKDSTHFCRCFSILLPDFNKPCTKCNKICRAMTDAKQFDEQRLRQIRNEPMQLNMQKTSDRIDRFVHLFVCASLIFVFFFSFFF